MVCSLMRDRANEECKRHLTCIYIYLLRNVPFGYYYESVLNHETPPGELTVAIVDFFRTVI